MRMLQYIAAFVIAGAAAGCDDGVQARKDAEMQKKIAANEKILAADLTAAEGIGDSWQAFQALKATEAKVCVGDPCTFYPSWQKLVDAENKRLTGAVAKGEPKAFETLYSPKPDTADGYAQARAATENVSRFLAYADQLHGAQAKDRTLLRRAAQLVLDGKYTVRDTTHAGSYLARAWAAGDRSAANSAALLYITINDYRNAYLWSLRCTSECSRDSQIDLDSLQRRLSPEAAKQAQQAALDTSVIELDTSGG